MYKIAVIGSADSVIGFRALGLDTYAVESCEEAKRTLHEITRPREAEYAIIYLVEDLHEPLRAEIAKYKDFATPAIILIPGKSGSLGLAEAALQSAVERAVGADIS